MKPFEKIANGWYKCTCSCFLLAILFRWAQDVYEFTESGKATVELVTDTKLEETQIVIQGSPRQIPNGHPNRLPNLVVPGLAFPGESRIMKLILFFISSAQLD